MAGIRFTKAEREMVEAGLKSVRRPDLKVGQARAIESALVKLEGSDIVLAKKTAGIGWIAAAEAMREVLGATLALPPAPDWGWQSRLAARIRDLGLTRDHFRTIAKVLKAKRWTVYSFEKAVWAADKLLAESELDVPYGPSNYRAPLEMPDL